MKTYELTYIIPASLNAEELSAAQKEVESSIQTNGGIIVKSDKTIAHVLAYPIKKQSSGYFFIVEFQMEEQNLKAVQEQLRKNNTIIRHFIVVKKPVKISKKRRVRRPLFVGAEQKLSEQKEGGEKLSETEIEKKIEEILGE